jgi:hypothetical protein
MKQKVHVPINPQEPKSLLDHAEDLKSQLDRNQEQNKTLKHVCSIYYVL